MHLFLFIFTGTLSVTAAMGHFTLVLFYLLLLLIAEDTSHQDVVATQSRVKVDVMSLCSGSSVLLV